MLKVRFVEFSFADSKRPVWVNPEHVTRVGSDPNNIDDSVIHFRDGQPVHVVGKANDVVAKLSK